MTAKEFFWLVAAMRHAQNGYFKDRSQQSLRAARALENDVDREIARTKAILKDQEEDAKWNAECNTECYHYAHGTCPYDRKEHFKCPRYRYLVSQA